MTSKQYQEMEDKYALRFLSSYDKLKKVMRIKEETEWTMFNKQEYVDLCAFEIVLMEEYINTNKVLKGEIK